MPDRSYIPNNIADQQVWVQNFADFVSANFLAVGLSSDDDAAVQAQNDAYQAAYTAAQTAETRSPVTIAAFVSQQTATLATMRQYAQIINNYASTSDAQRAAAQITIRKTTKTKITAPVTWPVLTILAALPLQHKMVYRDSSAPTVKVKAKPFGAIACQLFQHVGATPPANPADALLVGLFTRGPFFVEQDPANVGQTAYYYARWVTAKGLEGPLVGPVSMTIAA